MACPESASCRESFCSTAVEGIGFTRISKQFCGTFRKLGYPIFGGPCNKDPTIWGTILGSPIFGNPPYVQGYEEGQFRRVHVGVYKSQDEPVIGAG